MVRHAGKTRGAASTDHDNRITLAELSFDDALYHAQNEDNWLWNKPAGALFVLVWIQGAGGGGGGGDGVGGNGGGPGGSTEVWFAADDLPAQVAVAVGVGGAGGAATVAGSSGGTSAFLYQGEGGYVATGGGGGGAGGGPIGSPGIGNDPVLEYMQLALYAGGAFGALQQNGEGAIGDNGTRGMPGKWGSGGGGGTDGAFVGGGAGLAYFVQGVGAFLITTPFGGIGGGGGDGSDGEKGGPGSGGGGGGTDPDSVGGDGGHGWVRVRTFGIRPERVI